MIVTKAASDSAATHALIVMRLIEALLRVARLAAHLEPYYYTTSAFAV
jgi:hypothetical protein